MRAIISLSFHPSGELLAVASAHAPRRTRPVDVVLDTSARLGWRARFIDPKRRAPCAPSATPARNESPPATIAPDIANDRALLVSMDEADARGESASQSRVQ